LSWKTIGAGIFAAFDDVVPGLSLGIDHEARDHRVLGIALLDLGDLAQVRLDGPVADELDVV
jgi:hypothetical protein